MDMYVKGFFLNIKDATYIEGYAQILPSKSVLTMIEAIRPDPGEK